MNAMQERAQQYLEGLITFREFVQSIIGVLGDDYCRTDADDASVGWSEKDQLTLAQAIAEMGRR